MKKFDWPSPAVFFCLLSFMFCLSNIPVYHCVLKKKKKFKIALHANLLITFTLFHKVTCVRRWSTLVSMVSTPVSTTQSVSMWAAVTGE